MIPQDLPRALVAGGGAVTLVSSWGGDLDAVHTARCSFARHTVSTDSTPTHLNERDARLLAYLWREGHTSPFRHSALKFHLTTPLFVLRQWQKHTIGCAWNEASGRYIPLGDECHAPCSAWRAAPTGSVKQGSGDLLDPETQELADDLYAELVAHSRHTYTRLLALGVAREQARMVLPLSTLTQAVWTCSLQALVHFLQLRLHPHAQAETRDYAGAVLALTWAHAPQFRASLRATLDPAHLAHLAD